MWRNKKIIFSNMYSTHGRWRRGLLLHEEFFACQNRNLQKNNGVETSPGPPFFTFLCQTRMKEVPYGHLLFRGSCRHNRPTTLSHAQTQASLSLPKGFLNSLVMVIYTYTPMKRTWNKKRIYPFFFFFFWFLTLTFWSSTPLPRNPK